MKRFAAVGYWICLSLILIGMTCRMLWLAAGTETGLSTIKQQWLDATIGWIVGARTPVHSREPVAQAEFWLREADQVMHNHLDSAQLAMGAALVLDRPSPEFVQKYVKKITRTGVMGLYPQLDQEGINRAKEAFEARCKARCVDYAASATKLDSSNVAWWRLRALLLWSSRDSFNDSPRDPDWLAILEECKRHDPNNALYDYLAAYFYWESSAEMGFSDDRSAVPILVVKDAERFKRGIECFERGQTKPFIAVTDAGYSAVAEFLSKTKLPVTEHVQIVNSRGVLDRRSMLLVGVWRWHGLRAEKKAAAGNFRSALAMKRQSLHLINQITSAGASTAYNETATQFKVVTTEQMKILANKHKDSLSAEELMEINRMVESARLDKEVLAQAAVEMGQPRRMVGPVVFFVSRLTGYAIC